MSHLAISDFFTSWTTGTETKPLCMALYSHARALPGMGVQFVPRPGVSYSIRMHPEGNPSALAALIDVIDDDPDDRWLSVCFPDRFVTDPEEEGDLVPKGLGGNDARCFSIDTCPEGVEAYMNARLEEAAASVLREQRR